MSRRNKEAIILSTVYPSYFKDIYSYREYTVLRILANSDIPLGSWILKERLQEYELVMSIASIGRFLKDLDLKGYTKLVNNQGRKITLEGLDYFNIIKESLKRYSIEEEVIEASNPSNPEQLIKLICARKVIEIETARLAAIHATKEDIEILENAIDKHSNHVSKNTVDSTEIGCNFHELIGQASRNRFLSAALRLLIHEEIEMEKKFPYPATTVQGVHYIQEHEEILKAIKDRNKDKVAQLMEQHMNRLIEEIEIYFKNQVDMLKLDK